MSVASIPPSRSRSPSEATRMSLESADTATTLVDESFEGNSREALDAPKIEEKSISAENFLHLEEAIEAQVLVSAKEKIQSLVQSAAGTLASLCSLPKSAAATSVEEPPSKSSKITSFKIATLTIGCAKAIAVRFSKSLKKNADIDFDIKLYQRGLKFNEKILVPARAELIAAQKKLEEAEEKVSKLKSAAEKFETSIKERFSEPLKYQKKIIFNFANYSDLTKSINELEKDRESEEKKFKAFGFFKILNILGFSKFFRNEEKILSLERNIYFIKNNLLSIEKDFSGWIDEYYENKNKDINKFKKEFNRFLSENVQKRYAYVEEEGTGESNVLSPAKLKNAEEWSKWQFQEEEKLNSFIKNYKDFLDEEVSAKLGSLSVVIQLENERVRQAQTKVEEIEAEIVKNKEQIKKFNEPKLNSTLSEQSALHTDLSVDTIKAYA